MDQPTDTSTRSASSSNPFAGLEASRRGAAERTREKAPGDGGSRCLVSSTESLSECLLSPRLSGIEGWLSNTPLINFSVEGIKPLGSQGFNPDSETQRASVKERDAEAGVFGPDDYYGKLRIDRLKLAARIPEEMIGPVAREWLDRKRRARQGEDVLIETHDDAELAVLPGSAQSEMKKLVARGDGVTLAALKNAPKVADVSVAFGAARCWHSSLDALVEWARDFLALYSLDPDETLVTRLDLCVDVPQPFCPGDHEDMRGRLARDFASYSRDGRFTGFHTRRSEKRPLTLRVYDKRERADENDARSHWEAVWEEYSVPDDVPVWRVEYEAQRDRLRERGIDSWDDLTWLAIEQFWAYCTEEYARLEDASGSGSVADVWEQVQDASSEPAAERAEVEEVFDPAALRRQAMGCLRAAAEGQDITSEEELLRAAEAAEDIEVGDLYALLRRRQSASQRR